MFRRKYTEWYGPIGRKKRPWVLKRGRHRLRPGPRSGPGRRTARLRHVREVDVARIAGSATDGLNEERLEDVAARRQPSKSPRM
jgi:hypothetical protein